MFDKHINSKFKGDSTFLHVHVLFLVIFIIHHRSKECIVLELLSGNIKLLKVCDCTPLNSFVVLEEKVAKVVAQEYTSFREQFEDLSVPKSKQE